MPTLGEVGQPGGVVPSETGVAILRTAVVAAFKPDSSIETVDGDEREAVCLDEIAHRGDVHSAGEQL